MLSKGHSYFVTLSIFETLSASILKEVLLFIFSQIFVEKWVILFAVLILPFVSLVLLFFQVWELLFWVLTFFIAWVLLFWILGPFFQKTEYRGKMNWIHLAFLHQNQYQRMVFQHQGSPQPAHGTLKFYQHLGF